MQPIAVTDLDLAFPAEVTHLMPKWEEIPDQFKQWGGTRWNKFFADMFYRGISAADMKPKEGIDERAALRHIRAVAASFQPEHEHKEAAIAYLMSQWFEESSTWTPR